MSDLKCFLATTAAALLLSACALDKPTTAYRVEQRPALAVMDLKPVEASAGEAKAASEVIRSALAARMHARFRIIERQNLSSILSDMKLDMTLGKDVDAAVRIGKLVGAKFMSIGSLSRIGERYFLSVEIVDVETSEIKSAASQEAENANGIGKAAQRAAEALSATL